MFSIINWLQTRGRSLGYVYEQSIQFPLCSTAPNDSHRLWRIFSVQKQEILFDIRGWTGVQTPLKNFNQSSFVVKWRAVLTELFGAQPAWLPYKLPLWHEVSPCSYYWYQSSWWEKLRLQLSSNLPARTVLGQFWYAWKAAHTSSRDLKICIPFSTVLMSEPAEDLISPQCEIYCGLIPHLFITFHWVVCRGVGFQEKQKNMVLFVIICLQGCQANLSSFSMLFFIACFVVSWYTEDGFVFTHPNTTLSFIPFYSHASSIQYLEMV